MSVHVFWHRRPNDKQAWPVVYEDPGLAANCPFRVSDVVVVHMPPQYGQEPAQPAMNDHIASRFMETR